MIMQDINSSTFERCTLEVDFIKFSLQVLKNLSPSVESKAENC